VKDDCSIVARFRKFQLYCLLGFCVVVVDNAGSSGRGLHFEGHIKHKMGTVEMADQVDAIKYLINKGICDPARVLITGYSYGGYMSLMALAKYSDVFKIAVSGMPVTQWEAYDTGYTERYMGLPSTNPDGYRLSSVITHASLLPEESNRLFIVHGIIDENVHFANTTTFIQKLIERDIPYQLIVFPSDRHGFRSLGSARYLESRFLYIILNHL